MSATRRPEPPRDHTAGRDAADPAHRPPRWLERVLERALPVGLSGEGTLGDLAEAYERIARDSRLRARAWYVAQAVSIVAYRVFTGSGADSARTDSDLLMDFRWSLRTIFKRPGFAFGVVAVLGLGLGAVGAVYSVVDGTLRNTSWWADGDKAVAVWPGREFSFGHIELYREESSAYRAMGGYVELAYAVRTPDGRSESVNGAYITPELFRELAIQPAIGRALSDDDGFFASEAVAIIGHGLWRRTFSADPSIIGSRIEISGRPVTVIGIQGPGGVAPGGRAELWLPMRMDPRDDDYFKAQSYTLVGVLRDGATLEDAGAELDTYTTRLSDLFPMFYPDGWADGLAHVTRADAAQRRMIATPLLLLLAGTALLLLVTALNVGNLLLGRAIHRRQELAVRASLGASRWRVVRQLLVEGSVLTALAIGVGLATAWGGGGWVARLFVEEPVVASSSVLSSTVLTFVLTVSGLAWLVLNGIPVAHFVRTHRRDPQLRPESGSAVQRTLVTVQAALATLLLVSAALLVTTVGNLRDVPLGFDPEGLLTIELSPPEERVASVPGAQDLYLRLAERVGALPRVQAAGLTGWLPLRKDAPPTPINLQARPVDPREAEQAPMHMVDPGFFGVFGIEATQGRLLGTEDRALGAPSAIVVNESLANVLWPDGSAIGQLIAIDPHAWDNWAPVVGVVPDIRAGDITGPTGPALYVALAESPARDITLVVRADAAPTSLIGDIRQIARDIDPLVAVRSVAEMKDVVRSAYATSWVMMGLLLVLAGLATGLGALGIYAVLAQHVAANRKEIGVRMALGAQPGTVVGGVVRSGVLLAGGGIALGSAAAAVSNRFLDSLLFEVSALAPWAFVAPAGALAVAAALAAWVPAAQAGRLPPAEVLQSE